VGSGVCHKLHPGIKLKNELIGFETPPEKMHIMCQATMAASKHRLSLIVKGGMFIEWQ